MSKREWPCWTCTFRGGPDGTGTYYCTKPLPPLSIVEKRRLNAMTEPHQRYIGTEKQLRGDSPSDRPECAAYERG